MNHIIKIREATNLREEKRRTNKKKIIIIIRLLIANLSDHAFFFLRFFLK